MKGYNKKKFNIINLDNCCADWDNCSFIKKKFDGDDFVVYQKKEKMEIIENYYQKKIERYNSISFKNSKNKFKKIMDQFYDYENLNVQRRIHKCPNGIKKRIKEKMNSCIDLNRNICKDILNENYWLNKNEKIKDIKKGENKKTDTKDDKKREDDVYDYNDYIFFNDIYCY